MYEVIEKLSVIIELQEKLIVNLCSRLAQDESIEAELKRIDALKEELRDVI